MIFYLAVFSMFLTFTVFCCAFCQLLTIKKYFLQHNKVQDLSLYREPQTGLTKINIWIFLFGLLFQLWSEASQAVKWVNVVFILFLSSTLLFHNSLTKFYISNHQKFIWLCSREIYHHSQRPFWLWISSGLVVWRTISVSIFPLLVIPDSSLCPGWLPAWKRNWWRREGPLSGQGTVLGI